MTPAAQMENTTKMFQERQITSVEAEIRLV